MTLRATIRKHSASAFTSLLTRVREYSGPRELSTEVDYWSGYDRQTSQLPRTQTRWHLRDLESAVMQADGGMLRSAGQLWRSLRRDGMISGVLSTRTEGLVQLPKQFAGDETLVKALRGDFDAVFPQAELAMLSADGRGLGVGVGEFVQIAGSMPVLRRLDPEFLVYRWSEDRWYYQSVHGFEPVNPGDGRWVLHCPGGAVNPWSTGLWMALGRAFIAKEHAYFYRENYSMHLANAARVATSPQTATDEQRKGWFQRVAAWGVNTVFELQPGWDVKLLESNGRGFEVFQETIKTANEEIVITIAGQSVTTDGGAGFSNSAIHQAIRGDLIQADADALAATLNQQAIPVWANERFGYFAAQNAPKVSWDVTGASDLTREAAAMVQIAAAATAWQPLLAAKGHDVDIAALARKYGMPLTEAPNPAAANTAPTNAPPPAPTPLRSLPGGKAA